MSRKSSIFLLFAFALPFTAATYAQISGIGPVGEVTRPHTGFQFTEGPAADLQGNVYFTDVQRSRIHKIDTQGALTTFLENTQGMNGLMLDPRGRLIGCQGGAGAVVAIDLGPATDQLFLLLYGTGIRGRGVLSAVNLKIGGVDAEALYAGAQNDFQGLDQINVRVPRTLAGRGEVDAVLAADGQTSNMVRVNIK